MVISSVLKLKGSEGRSLRVDIGNIGIIRAAEAPGGGGPQIVAVNL
jgi:hypothetical protein